MTTIIQKGCGGMLNRDILREDDAPCDYCEGPPPCAAFEVVVPVGHENGDGLAVMCEGCLQTALADVQSRRQNNAERRPNVHEVTCGECHHPFPCGWQPGTGCPRCARLAELDDLTTHDRADEAFEGAVALRAWDLADYAARVVVNSGCYDAAKPRARAFLKRTTAERETFR